MVAAIDGARCGCLAVGSQEDKEAIRTSQWADVAAPPLGFRRPWTPAAPKSATEIR